jgi:5-methylcytosine-specific restriction endonuclease McrA
MYMLVSQQIEPVKCSSNKQISDELSEDEINACIESKRQYLADKLINKDHKSYQNKYYYRIRRKQQSVIVGRSVDTWHQMEMKVKEKIKDNLIKHFGLICSTLNGYGCGHNFIRGELEIDHVLAISNGGPVCDEANLQLLCNECHNKKTEGHDNKYIENRIKIREATKFIY